MDKPKLAVEARTVVRDHSTPRKQERPNLTLENRLRLALGAARELEVLADSMREYLRGSISADDFEEEVALHALLDRLKAIADALQDVATWKSDKDHDAAALEGVLRFAFPPD